MTSKIKDTNLRTIDNPIRFKNSNSGNKEKEIEFGTP